MPEKDTAYTREGTIAHAMAEGILRDMFAQQLDYFPEPAEYLTSRSGVILAEFCRTCEHEGLDWKEMAETVYDHYCRLVYEAYLGARLEDPDAELLIEARLKLAEFIPEGFGSSDAVLIYGHTLEVFDLKYGKGVKVDATHNAQMLCYALGAYCGPAEAYDIQDVHMTILQPRLRHESTWAVTSEALLEWAHERLRPAALLAFEGKGEQKPGEHCRFCKVAAKCKALADYTLRITQEPKEPGVMSLDEIAQLLPHFSTIKSWISSVEEYALAAALEGDTIPGFKVVEGRSIRKLSNVSTALNRLADAGIEPESYLKPRELKTITELEKTLTKKGFTAILGDLVIKPEGKPTLVEEADPRQPYSKAKTDFADIIETL